MFRRQSRLAAACVAVLGALTGCAPSDLEVVPTRAHWCTQERPAHVIVSDALPLACRVSICEAVDWFASQDVRYLTCATVEDSQLTPGQPFPRFIQVIVDPPEDPGAAGDTRVHRVTPDCIDSAEIRMDPYWCGKGNTEAHELGHALGLGHDADDQNLMWPANLPGGRELTDEQREQLK